MELSQTPSIFIHMDFSLLGTYAFRALCSCTLVFITSPQDWVPNVSDYVALIEMFANKSEAMGCRTFKFERDRTVHYVLKSF
jgi:hypothetical protein